MELEKVPNQNIINGMKKSFNNAEALLNEAFLLQSNKMYARAYTLCQFAIEELGKIQILFELWINRINGNLIDYEQLNKNFTDHKIKTKISIQTEIAFFKLMQKQTGYGWIDKIIKNREGLLSNISEINNLKNESLYVSLKEDDFQAPEEVIDEEKYSDIYANASMRKEFSKNFVRVIEQHIDEIDELAKLIKEDDENAHS